MISIMNLNNLKPAWRQLKVLNSMRPMDQKEILSVLEMAEGMAVSKSTRLLMHTLIFIVLTFCCQGG
jgi:hypothetical protein